MVGIPSRRIYYWCPWERKINLHWRFPDSGNLIDGLHMSAKHLIEAHSNKTVCNQLYCPGGTTCQWNTSVYYIQMEVNHAQLTCNMQHRNLFKGFHFLRPRMLMWITVGYKTQWPPRWTSKVVTVNHNNISKYRKQMSCLRPGLKKERRQPSN